MLMAVVGDAATGRVPIRHQDMSKLKIRSPSLVPGLSRNRANVLYNNEDAFTATALAQHRSSNSNYIPIDHPSRNTPTLQGDSDFAEASVTAARGKRPRAVTKHRKEVLERPLKRSRIGEDEGSRRSASLKKVTRGARGPYGPRPAKEQKAMERKALLEADPFAYKVRVHWVRCRGCDNDISLDKRSEYYPGLWIKHRRKCKEIAKLREKESESVKGEQTQRPDFQYPPLPLGGRTQFENDGEPSSRSSTPTLSSPQVSGSGRILADTGKKLDDDAHSVRSSYSEPRYDPNPGAPSSFTVERQYEGRQDTINLEDESEDEMIVCPPRLAKLTGRAIYAQWLKNRATYQPNWSEEERVYWSYAPFAPADPDQSASKGATNLDSNRVHYRFSSRWELETGFRDAKHQLAELTKGGIGHGSYT